MGDFLRFKLLFAVVFLIFCWLVGVFSCLIYFFLLAKNRDFPVGKGVKDLTLNPVSMLGRVARSLVARSDLVSP